MKKMILNNKGFTLAETLVAAASVAIVAFSLMIITEHRTQLMARVRFSYTLAEAVILNVNEVKTRAFATLPTAGNCLARRYDLFGNFISEQSVAVSDQRCGREPLPQKVMEIVWRVTGPAGINANFTPAQFLKLPKYKASIIQVEVLGRMLAPPPGPPEQTFGTVVFRK